MMTLRFLQGIFSYSVLSDTLIPSLRFKWNFSSNLNIHLLLRFFHICLLEIYPLFKKYKSLIYNISKSLNYSLLLFCGE